MDRGRPESKTRTSNNAGSLTPPDVKSRRPAKVVTRCLSRYENLARERGFACIAGVDEVGRGALFGPVFAAAVVLHPERPIRGLRDSKVLDESARASLAAEIRTKCVGWAVGAADSFEIDQVNIYQASRLAMKRAVEALPVRPDYLLIDALRLDLEMQQEPLIGGDARCRAIAAASIVAKVCRDSCMTKWHEIFPHYNLASNKGYSTPDHKRALRQHGPTSFHRFSFMPVRVNSSEHWWAGYASQTEQGDLFDGMLADDTDLNEHHLVSGNSVIDDPATPRTILEGAIRS